MNAHIVTRFIDRVPLAFQEGDGQAADKVAEADNVRRLQATYRAIAEGKFADFAAMLHEEITLEIVGTPSVPFLGSWQGKQIVAEAVRTNFGMLEEQEPELHTVVAQGDTIVMTGREQGRIRGNGQSYDVQFVQCHTFRAGQLFRVRQVVIDTPT